MKPKVLWEQIEAFPVEVEKEKGADEAPKKKLIRRWHSGFPETDGVYEVRDSIFPSLVDLVEMRNGELLTRLCEHPRPCPWDRTNTWKYQFRPVVKP
jgi:hypothetical protein